MPEKKTDIKKAILRRVRWLYVLLFGAGLAITAKIIYIQYGPNGDELRQRSEQITFERLTVPADRGDILSWDGRLLATSIPMYEIRMDFAAQGLVDSIFMRDVDSLARCLSNFFGNRSQAAYKNMLMQAHANKRKNRYTLISPRRVDHMELKEVRRFPIFRMGANRGGFMAVQINKRQRPHGNLASRTIGSVNEAGTKVGIEGAFDRELRGEEGNVLMQKISGSFRIPVADELSVDPIDGIDVVTTLDIELQDVAETALRQQLAVGEADWGTAVLMEVATGEIRAMTNLTRKGDQFVEDFNYAIGMNLEPGSTFKLASLLALLDDAGAKLDEPFPTGGTGGVAYVGKVKVVDTHDYGNLDLRGIFEKSSNVGFALAVNKYYAKDPQRFVNHLVKMGLKQPLNLQIAGEADPIIRNPGERWWDGTTLTMMAYGYALRLTPLKTLTFYNAIANNGRMMAPLFVKELRQYGNTIRTYQPEVMVPEVASKETLAAVTEAMQGVVEEGTARILKNPYYKVAGKTGTAQIAQGRRGYTDAYGGRHYLATLVGYFPADNPKYTCIVAIKTYFGQGRYKSYYGASLSGPVFRAIADRVYAKNVLWQPAVAQKNEKVDAQPSLKSGNAQEMRRVAERMKMAPTVERGVKGWMAFAQEDSVELLMPIAEGAGVVPPVVGMGLKEAIYLLEKEGLIVTFSGAGKVTSQSIKAGTTAVRGALIELKLKPASR